MKNLFFSSLIAFAGIGFAAEVLAADAYTVTWSNDGGWTYLGGALNPQHCAQIAGQQGYALASYGGYVWDGLQWTYLVNGCFGSGRQGGGDAGGGIANYDVYVKTAYDAYDCKDDIEWEFGSNVRVRVTDARSGGSRLEVRSRQPILDDLCRIECVSSAYRLNPTPNPSSTSCYNRGR